MCCHVDPINGSSVTCKFFLIYFRVYFVRTTDVQSKCQTNFKAMAFIISSGLFISRLSSSEGPKCLGSADINILWVTDGCFITDI